ncbi:MAG: hypothetical protein IIY78_08830 [Clostridia bacterium]|nr:hypothetical protein [Clostridia bacterium]
MKKLIFTFILCAVLFAANAQDITMPTNDVSNVNSIYALLAVVCSTIFSFVILLIKLIFDNKKNTDLAEYIRKHEEQHKADRENFKEAILTNEKRLDKTNEILQRLVDNDIEQEKRLARLEAQK